MKHSLDPEKLGQFELPITEAIQKCVHCGFCLPSCPTYQLEGLEMDSPRGRILLMKEALEENIEFEQASKHVDRCLGCLACETSCPSGVAYGSLLSPFRSIASRHTNKNLSARISQFLAHQTIPYPTRFRWAIRLGQLVRLAAGVTPGFLRSMLTMIPERLAPPAQLPSHSPAAGETRGRVSLLTGCAQQVLAPQINVATIRVLNRSGVDVVIPPDQGCCGGLGWHDGRLPSARKLAERNLRAFAESDDPIVTNAAGCGSAIHEYPIVFQGTDHKEAATEFQSRVVDVSEYLHRLPLARARLNSPIKIGYHDACHLAHAQNIRKQPRQLLRHIENAELVPIHDSEQCCGSAGTYNLQQPEIANRLGRLKAQAIIASGCEIVVMGNIGCLIQVAEHLKQAGSSIEVLHTIELLDRAQAEAAQVAE